MRERTHCASTPKGGNLAALVEAMQERQVKRDELVTAIATVEAPMKIDIKSVEKRVRARLSDWRGLLTRQTQDGRQLLRELLAAPLKFIPEDRQYRFTVTTEGQLLALVVALATLDALASQRRGA